MLELGSPGTLKVLELYWNCEVLELCWNCEVLELYMITELYTVGLCDQCLLYTEGVSVITSQVVSPAVCPG